MPFGKGEEFLIEEAIEIALQEKELLIIPRSVSSSLVNNDAECLVKYVISEKLLSFPIFLSTISNIFRHPIATLRVLRSIFSEINLNTIKNLIVLPKSIWIADVCKNKSVTHIHAHWASTTATMAYIASVYTKIPWSFTAHRGDIVANNLLKLKSKSASFIRCISQSSSVMIKQLGVSADKHRVIHMGVSVKNAQTARSRQTKVKKVLCPANLIPVKGHKYLLEAVNKLHKKNIIIELILAGDGELRNSLNEYTQCLRIENHVKFVGFVPHDELISNYLNCDVGIVVLPSIDLGKGCHEGIPVTLMEAMVFGIPVVSTYTGGIPELLGNCACVLVKPQNSD
jgi:glycosyltransferase involved in cell wall biosynthesis